MFVLRSMRLALLATVALAGAAEAQVILGSGDSALSGATIIDFESFVVGDYNTLTSGDVTFSADPGETLRIGPEGEGGQYNHDGQHLQNNRGNTSPVMVAFLNPVTAFGVRHGAMNVAWTMRVYDVFDQLIASTGIIPTGGSLAGGYIGWNDTQGRISRVELIQPSRDWVQFDDFAYVSGVPVPEPGSLLLLATGAFAMVIIGRRRQTA